MKWVTLSSFFRLEIREDSSQRRGILSPFLFVLFCSLFSVHVWSATQSSFIALVLKGRLIAFKRKSPSFTLLFGVTSVLQSLSFFSAFLLPLLPASVLAKSKFLSLKRHSMSFLSIDDSFSVIIISSSSSISVKLFYNCFSVILETHFVSVFTSSSSFIVVLSVISIDDWTFFECLSLFFKRTNFMSFHFLWQESKCERLSNQVSRESLFQLSLQSIEEQDINEFLLEVFFSTLSVHSNRTKNKNPRNPWNSDLRISRQEEWQVYRDSSSQELFLKRSGQELKVSRGHHAWRWLECQTSLSLNLSSC